MNTGHLGRTSPCPTPHRTVNFDNLHGFTTRFTLIESHFP